MKSVGSDLDKSRERPKGLLFRMRIKNKSLWFTEALRGCFAASRKQLEAQTGKQDRESAGRLQATTASPG